jgi:hypothetical protein
MVGDTNMESCTRPNHHHHQNKTCNIRKREKRTIKTLHLSIKILQYLFLHKFVAQEEDSFITSRTRERDKERERENQKALCWCLYCPFVFSHPVFFFLFFLVKRVKTKGKLIGYLFVIERQQQK